MRTVLALGLSFAAAGLASACGGYDSYVESDRSALGKVVVYRNGIAFYERKARVEDNRLTLEVPSDKVDDFLKSLTVTDARTGEPIPVSFPTRDAAGSSTVEMTVQLPPGPARDVVLTYITEAPAWKPSYRVVVDDATSKVRVEGWAVVDNTSGEDWQEVVVGVGSSSALSFRYDLRTVRTIHRETLASQERFAVAPPTGGSVHGGAQQPQVLGQVAQLELSRDLDDAVAVDEEPMDMPMPAPEPAPTVADVESSARITLGGASSGSVRGGGGPRSKPRPGRIRPTRPRADKKVASKPPDTRAHKEARRRLEEQRQRAQQRAQRESRVRALAEQVKQTKGDVVIEGYAAPGEANAAQSAAERANRLRNLLVEKGVAPARLKVAVRGVVPGQPAGARLVHVPTEQAANPAEAEGDPVGESHFQSEGPMTVGRGTSAMVSVFDRGTDGDVVYLYDAEAERGHKRYAFKSIRFKNPTKSTLESGPVTVYGSARFIGEGLTEPIPPGSSAVIPFALDRQVVVDREGSTGDRIHRLVTLTRGVLTAEVQHLKTTKLKITNRLHTTTTVLVRHNVKRGWKLEKAPEVYEKLGTSHLFALTLEPYETRDVEIEEATPLTRTIDLRTQRGLDLVQVFLQAPGREDAFAEPMRELLKIWTEMENHRETIRSVRERMAEYRARMNELHTQIASLQAAKTGGALVRHLTKKMKEISGRIDKGTLEIVNNQEKLMLARIRFQDGVSELTLKPQADKQVTERGKG